MNVFATLKTVFFGSKFLSAPVPSDGTPRRDFVSALNGLMPLCRTIPGVHLAVDIREGRVALVLNWTSRTDGNALAGVYHYIVSGKDGVKEVNKSQVLPAERRLHHHPAAARAERRHQVAHHLFFAALCAGVQKKYQRRLQGSLLSVHELRLARQCPGTGQHHRIRVQHHRRQHHRKPPSSPIPPGRLDRPFRRLPDTGRHGGGLRVQDGHGQPGAAQGQQGPCRAFARHLPRETLPHHRRAQEAGRPLARHGPPAAVAPPPRETPAASRGDGLAASLFPRAGTASRTGPPGPPAGKGTRTDAGKACGGGPTSADGPRA